MKNTENQGNSSKFINSVNRALDILEYLFAAGKDVSISQISRDLNMHKSTVYRSLITLQNRGYVAQNPESELYKLGIKTFILGTHFEGEAEIENFLQPYLHRLNEKFGEAVNASVLQRNYDGIYKSVIIAKVSSMQSLNANTKLGSLNECYCAAVGKCLLAFSENIDLSIYEKYPMQRFTNSTITTIPELEKELEKVRKEMYAIDNEEAERQLFCIGTPILKDGVAIAAMSISGPTGRINDEHIQEKIDYLKELGKEISEKLSLNNAVKAKPVDE